MSAATDPLQINDRIAIPASELQESFARSGGPGGQHVNKVETKVELRWRPEESAALSEQDRRYLLRRLGSRLTRSGELVVTSSRTRDREKNREDARARLASAVSAALARPARRRPTRPTRGSIARRLEGKRRRSRKKNARKAPGRD